MSKSSRSLLALVAVLTLSMVATGCGGGDDEGSGGGGGAGGKELRTIKLGTQAPLTHGYYPIIAADALGYFEDEGLKVEVRPAAEDVPPPALLEQGQVDISTQSAPDVLFAAAADGDVKVLFDPWTGNAEGIAAVDPAIQSLQDLKGKRVGVGTDEDESFLAVALDEAGMSLDDVDVVVIGESTPVVADALESGKIAAYGSSYVVFGTLEAQGVELTDLTPDTLGVVSSTNFMVKPEAVADDPDMLVGFFRAFAKGLWAGQVSPGAVARMYRERVPDDWRDENLGQALLDEVIPRYEPVDDDRIGEIYPKNWQYTEQRLRDSGALEEDVDVEVLLDNQFVAGANEFDRAKVKADADAWLEKESK